MAGSDHGHRRYMALAMVVVMSVLGGCGGADPEPSPTSTTATRQSDQIPAEFPEPPEIVDYQELTASSDQIQVQWETSLSTDETIAFYDEMLPAQDWGVTSRREGDDSTRFAIEGHGWEGAVTVLGGDPARVLLQLGRPDGG